MAEEVNDSFEQLDGMHELAICQPAHPNQAIFLEDLNISLQDFRAKLLDSALKLPDEWVFMSRATSLISVDQEERLQLTCITQTSASMNVLGVMVAPALSYRPAGRTPQPRRTRTPQPPTPLTSLASIVGAVRDIFVTSVQPNLHEFGKPLVLAAVLATVIFFVMALALSLFMGILKGMGRDHLAPMLRQQLCGGEGETTTDHLLPSLKARIDELEMKMSSMRQVEVGTLACEDNNGPLSSHELFVPFRKTRFEASPRLVFSLRNIHADDTMGSKLDVVDLLNVNSTGFTARCRCQYLSCSALFSWVAVGK